MTAEQRLAAQRTRAMRALTDDERAAAIAAASNVIGFDRFARHARRVQLRDELNRSLHPGAPE